jgi:GTP-binding protein
MFHYPSISFDIIANIVNRLRRAFLLLDSTLDPKDSDLAVLALLAQNSIPYQLLLTKIDRILYPTGRTRPGPAETQNLQKLHDRCVRIRQIVEDGVHDRLGKLKVTNSNKKKGNRVEKLPVQDVLCTSADMHVPGVGRLGIGETRWAILQACGMDILDNKHFLDGIPILDDSVAPASLEK